MLGLSVFFFLFHEGWGVWAGGRKAISADLHTCSAMSGMQQGTPLNLMVVGYRLHYLTPIEKRPVGSKLRTEWDDTLVVGLWLAFKKYILVTFPNFPSCLWWGCQVHMPGGGGGTRFQHRNKIWKEGLAVLFREDWVNWLQRHCLRPFSEVKGSKREKNPPGLDPEPSDSNSWPSNYVHPIGFPVHLQIDEIPCHGFPEAWISKEWLIRMFWPNQGTFQGALGISPPGRILLDKEGLEVPQCHWKSSLSHTA